VAAFFVHDVLAVITYELAYRLVKMFSFWGDTVLDPFCGTGTTMLAAMKCGRNSIGIEIDEEYCRMTLDRLKAEARDLPAEVNIEFSVLSDNDRDSAVQGRACGLWWKREEKKVKEDADKTLKELCPNYCQI